MDRLTAEPRIDQLFGRWHQHGDQHARDQLVERYLPLARKLARRFQGAREPLDDLVQVASLGLVKAIDRFQPERGVSFQSFAVPTILGELKRYFRDSGWAVHVPRGAQERAVKVEQAQRKLLSETGRAPTFHQLAEYLELSLEDVIAAVETAAAHHSISFETPRDDGDGQIGTLGDVIGAIDERFELIESGATIERATRLLTERERSVLALRFVADRTQTEIARDIGVSQMQVSRILRQALARLAGALQDETTAPVAVR